MYTQTHQIYTLMLLIPSRLPRNDSLYNYEDLEHALSPRAREVGNILHYHYLL